jgi:hypothetical protein
MLLVCCFCDKVRDDTMCQASESYWQDLQVYMVSRNPKRENTILSYTCCHNCLQGNPHAIAFRTRQRPSSASVPDAGTRSRRSVVAVKP